MKVFIIILILGTLAVLIEMTHGIIELKFGIGITW